MLLTNQCLDKLAAARIDFALPGMLDGPLLAVNVPPELPQNDEGNDVEDMPGMTC